MEKVQIFLVRSGHILKLNLIVKTCRYLEIEKKFLTNFEGKINFMFQFQGNSSVQFSHSVVSNSLRPHEPQHGRRKWEPTPVLLPGKFHGWKSLVGYSPWGHKESDTTKQFHLEPQNIRPPCPSPTPGVHPNPCPLSQ